MKRAVLILASLLILGASPPRQPTMKTIDLMPGFFAAEKTNQSREIAFGFSSKTYCTLIPKPMARQNSPAISPIRKSHGISSQNDATFQRCARFTCR